MWTRETVQPAGHPGPEDSLCLPGLRCEEIQFRAAHLIIISQRNMGFIHQDPEVPKIILLQGDICVDNPEVLIDRVLRPLFQKGISDEEAVLLKALFIELPERMDRKAPLQAAECLLAFSPPVIVGAPHKLMLFVGIGDDEAKIPKIQKSIFKGEILCIQIDRVIFFPHGARKLIHNAAVHAVIAVLRVLSQQSEIQKLQRKMKKLSQ